MKSFKIIFPLVFLTVSFLGCDEYLDEQPITKFYEGQIFSNEEGLETAVNGMYINFANYDYHGAHWHNIVPVMSGKFWSSQPANADATGLNCTSSNINLEGLWGGMYEAVNSANIIIQQLENSSVELSNEDVALGQAYLIRGITYFDLVRFWGGVPIKTSPATAEDLHTPRASKQEVYNLIISDLEQAKLLLPDFGEYRPERPVKYVANAYLAKVYMQLAGEDGGNPSFWQNAYDEAIQVYGKYSLVQTYAELFDDVTNRNTVESMFELNYSLAGGLRNSDVIRLYNPNGIFPNLPTFGRIRPNKETFDQHVEQYPGDPRIDASFFYESYVRANGNTQRIYPSVRNGANGYTALKKYTDPNYNGSTTLRNFIKLRYADVLLMLAEIENELNGPDNAYQYVNEVLNRARNTSTGETAEPANWSGLSKEDFRMRIMRERQYELLGEGHQFFDTRRRGYDYFLDEVVELHNNHPTINVGNRDYIYPVSVKNMLFPIPFSEISGNQKISQADQNPGY
ncbi:RagB/SusD family nutrient uptake outer membrane protein [Aegicerativicinus sediminis]|uniref:RagB/SusD family nutrient uptake outer membrane protein n=1 Tax=Aegicerativicinus sediminis TaxID=2893202 RepID=UPI001E609777|nr:RagB/SusD family nutrient uptake outer membrane protein [Aegicerativicinus sediminis]